MASEKGKVYLVNTQPRLLHLPHGVVKGVKESATATLSQDTNIGEGVALPPSVDETEKGQKVGTEIDAEQWTHLKANNKQVKSWLDLGWIKEDGVAPPKATEPAKAKGHEPGHHADEPQQHHREPPQQDVHQDLAASQGKTAKK